MKKLTLKAFPLNPHAIFSPYALSAWAEVKGVPISVNGHYVVSV